MHRSWTLAVLALAGCGADGQALPATCLESADVIERALGRAPGAVRLPDGTPLSQCVRRATSDSDLQSFGLLATRVAERLEQRAPADPRAALRLGYLAGAAERGARNTNGVTLELAYRLRRSASLSEPSPPVRDALLRGLRAGEAGG